MTSRPMGVYVISTEESVSALKEHAAERSKVMSTENDHKPQQDVVIS